MKEIKAQDIIDVVSNLCIQANVHLPSDVESCIKKACTNEPWQQAKGILQNICENIEISTKENMPLCQDTGMACVFLELGQDVHIVDMPLYEAINEGVRQGYEKGFLRKSVVQDPFNRVNTGDNTPALISTEIVSGDNLKITIMPKGFGSENMSRLKMFAPSAGLQGIEDFIVDTVCKAGSNPCPPIVIGVGIGGSFDKVAYLSKKAMLQNLEENNKDPFYAEMEQRLLKRINETGIGPQGFGGKTTALKVNILAMPTHIAALPVAVNVNCHVTRHAEAVL